MFQPATVSLSGPAFSFLLYETSKAPLRQEGFLLGEIIHKETTSITDNDRPQVNISKLIRINSLIPCPEKDYFDKGRVNKEKVKALLGACFSKVVAWYKFQKFSSSKFTLKDKMIHKQLLEFFDVPPDLFSCCFLSTEGADELHTYNHSQTFVRYHNGVLDRLNVHIPNLSESNNSYKTSEPASETFKTILSGLKIDLKKTHGLVAVTHIENAVQKHINDTVKELAETERKMYELENEILALRSNGYESDETDELSSGDAGVALRNKTNDATCDQNTVDNKRTRGGKRKSGNDTITPETSRNDTEIVLSKPENEENDTEMNGETNQSKLCTPKTKSRGRPKKKT